MHPPPSPASFNNVFDELIFFRNFEPSGESRKIFLPVLGPKPRTVVKVEKNFVVAYKKRQISRSGVFRIYKGGGGGGNY